MLHQMLCFTGEDFEPEQLMTYRRASTYIDTACKHGNTLDLLIYDLCSGNLRKHPDLFDYPFELSVRNSKVLEKEEDVVSTAAIMQKCLKLDPAQRLGAEELLIDPWFAGID
jgi:serine/threonine protein kinase